jgi:predicted ATPase/GAF domain-containing protein/ABC-type transporter Mla MlaB component
VLLKVPEPGANLESTLARLRHESRLLRDLNIPGAPQVLALEAYPGGRALIFADVPGVPLSKILAKGRLDLRTALRIGVTLAEVLEDLHRRDVIHKDLRPQHILCDLDGPSIHLVEFGVASRLSQEPTRAGSFVGELSAFAYISPEQTGRMNRMLDTRSDLYSLGVVLHEMLTGTTPFPSATDPLALVHSHVARLPPSPREVTPEVPEVVSRIVERLLAKNAEERYQTAGGLRADLQRCLNALENGAPLPEFPLGRSDKDGRLRIPQRLYGREAEVAALLAAFEEVSAGAAKLMLISGYSGVGKSALVHEVNKPIAARGGSFISGKFDQFNRSVPYAALAQALHELSHVLLGESAIALATWTERIRQALAPSAKLITDLVPDLALIIGRQPDLPALGPAEAQNRLELALRRFVQAVSRPEHPLVLFLDDLQWIDSASLKLVQSLITDGEQSHLLIIGSYRDNEVDSAHLLTLALDTLRKAGVRLEEITLKPLGEASVVALLSDALDLPASRVEPLARVLIEKTQGNPFFLNQYLTELHTEKVLWLDERAQEWRWNMEAVSARVVADNVVALMTGKLRRLTEETQQVLTLAAAIGHQFDASTLATISGLPMSDTVSRLWPALEAGVVVPASTDYRFLFGGDQQASGAEEGRPANAWFKFLHDRVQQAAYALTPDELLPGLHLRIGRLLLERHGGYAELLKTSVFDTARHLNRGAKLITDPDERLSLARLNLSAGLRAKAAAAYETAASFLADGAAILDPQAWETHYELSFALHLERASCEYLSGRIDVAEPLFDELTPRVRSDVDYADLCSLRMILYSTQARFAEVVTWALRGLSRLGFDLPTSAEEQQAGFMSEMSEVMANLGERRVADLVDAPVITEPRLQKALLLLSKLTPAAYYVSPPLFGLSLIKQVNVSLKHGHTDVSAFGYASYGFLLTGMLGQPTLGYELGRLALALNERFQNAELTCQLHVVFAMGLHATRPLQEALELHRIGYRAGLESGDVNYLSYGCYNTILIRLAFGDELALVASDVEQFLRLTARSKEVASSAQMTLCKQMIANFSGQTVDRSSLSSESFDEERFRAEQEANVSPPLLCRYYIVKEQLHYWYGEHYQALEEGDRAERFAQSIAGLFESTQHAFYMCLTLIAVSRGGSQEHRQSYAERIARYQGSMDLWASSCPENFEHRALLLRAEVADLAGRPEATELYDRAIEAAERSPFLPDLALANELSGRHHLAQGRKEQAVERMLAARRCYARWGAVAKVTLLDKQHKDLFFPEAPPQEMYIGEHEPARTVDANFDALTVLRVVQTIAGEIVFSRLLEQLMRTVTTHAGAQRGYLILDRGGSLLIEAMITHDPDTVQLELNEPIESSERLSTSIVQYVARTRETVVLGDASQASRFATDRYIMAHKPKSVLCLALTHQGRLTGVLYLENSLAQNVFAPDQVELLRMLSSHAAISVQNALLYANVERVTAQLRSSNDELNMLNGRLQTELSERERAERERAALQEEVIRFQEARLAEQSTPLIPITDKIMVMPIIGTVDEPRARRVIETALHGAQTHRAQVVILDITGMKQVDTGAADSLIQTARALRLLGTHVVLTGISPEIAQTLIGLNVDLSAIVTRGTLQSGIAYALQHVGDATSARGALDPAARPPRPRDPR